MIYFSELKNRKVYTEDRIYVGRLQDVIFLASDKPTVTKFVIKPRTGDKPFMTPLQYVQKINSVVVLHKEYEEAVLSDNELYV